MYSINSYTTLILDKCFDFKTCTMTSTYLYKVCISNKSILLSLVACVEFSYISVTISLIILLKNLCGDVELSRNIKQPESYVIGAANGVRLQRYSGLDTGVELERFHSNSCNKYNKNNVYMV